MVFHCWLKMNSAWGESYRLTRDCKPQLGRANTTVFWVSFTLRGSVCAFSHILQLGLSMYLVNRATVRFGHFLFAPVPRITSNRLLFRM